MGQYELNISDGTFAQVFNDAASPTATLADRLDTIAAAVDGIEDGDEEHAVLYAVEHTARRLENYADAAPRATGGDRDDLDRTPAGKLDLSEKR